MNVSLRITAKNVLKYKLLFGPYFAVFVMNTQIYSVNLRVQSEYGKIWTRKNPYSGTFYRGKISSLSSKQFFSFK